MGNELRFNLPPEGRRLLWLMALGFGIFFMMQHFELPYGNVFLSLSSVGKTKVSTTDNSSVANSSSSLQMDDLSENGNLASSDGLNSTYPSTDDVMANVSVVSNGKDANENHFNDQFDNSDPEDEDPSKDSVELNGNQMLDNIGRNDTLLPEKVMELDHAAPAPAPSTYITAINNVSFLAPTSAGNDTTNTSIVNSSTSPAGANTDFRTPVSVEPITPSVNRDAAAVTVKRTPKPRSTKAFISPSINFTVDYQFPKIKESSLNLDSAFVPISEMNDMLLRGLTSPHSVKPRWTSSADQELLHVKSLIENAPNVQDDPLLYAPLFRNVSTFKRSYELMEQTLKVYIYKEGQRPIFHTPVLKGIYASEGWFMKLLKSSKQFVTRKPKKAHLFYLPFSSRMLEETLYVPDSHSRKNLIKCLNDYLDVISRRYPFWNRTTGSDHFLVACHDWAPSETKHIMSNCIRALCNSDAKEGFVFGKDVSLPETYVRSPQNPLRQLGGKPPSKRKILAFFAGNMHGYFRPILLKYWENKDPDMKIFGKLPNVKGQMNYIQHMQSSKYCICAKGFEVNSPRVVEAIFYECIPVIISDNFVPPFFETLNWESFAVFVMEKDIPDLKNILLSIPKKKYLQMQKIVKLVQKHFLWHPTPVKYDIFHMTLHSIWFNRVFQTPV